MKQICYSLRKVISYNELGLVKKNCRWGEEEGEGEGDMLVIPCEYYNPSAWTDALQIGDANVIPLDWSTTFNLSKKYRKEGFANVLNITVLSRKMWKIQQGVVVLHHEKTAFQYLAHCNGEALSHLLLPSYITLENGKGTLN